MSLKDAPASRSILTASMSPRYTACMRGVQTCWDLISGSAPASSNIFMILVYPLLVASASEFSLLQNKLKLEDVVFRQHLEDLLRSVTDSEFNLKRMMDDPECDDRLSPDMNSTPKHKLSDNDELDIYLSLYGKET
ncbi:hypothetical protein Hte_006908 [Hypoxylon texense]